MNIHGRFDFLPSLLFIAISMLAIILCAAANEGGHESGRRDTLIIYPDTFAESHTVVEAAAPIGEYPPLSEVGLSLPEYVKLRNADGGIEEILFEDYITGVVAAEMPYSFHGEALKAQAVAARSYAFYRTRNGHEGGCDVCGDFRCCMAYISRSDAEERFGEAEADRMLDAAEEAVSSTRGIVMLYDSEAVCAVFHSSSSGQTRSSKEVWGGDYAYLGAVETFGEAASSEASFTIDEANMILSANGYAGFGEENGAEVSERTIFIGGTEMKPTELRRLFGLASASFEAEYSDGALTFHIHGSGHGVGMSQYGAEYMARGGSRFDEILLYYYSGVMLYK